MAEPNNLLRRHPEILYLALMRFRYLLICVLILTGCARRSITNSAARDKIMEIPAETLKKDDVEVVKVTRFGGSEAIAETRMRTAFRIEKVDNEWVVREVRIGHGQWEKIANLTAALEAVKTEETKQMLDSIAAAILKFQKTNGRMPVFKDYIALSDQLTPTYLTPLIRLDAWRQPLEAERTDENTILLISGGPDGRLGTSDDIRKIVTR